LQIGWNAGTLLKNKYCFIKQRIFKKCQSAAKLVEQIYIYSYVDKKAQRLGSEENLSNNLPPINQKIKK